MEFRVAPIANAVNRQATAAWRGRIIFPWDQVTHLQFALQAMDERMAEGIAAGTNEAADQFRADMVRAIAREINLDPSIIDQSVRVTARADVTHPAARVTVRDDAQPLDRYPVDADDQGILAAIYRDDAPRRIEGGFIATMPGGDQGVFRRQGTSRLPLDKQFGPSPADVLRDRPAVLREQIEEARYTLVNHLLATRDRIVNDTIEKWTTPSAGSAITRFPEIATSPFRAIAFIAAVFRGTL